MESQLKTPYLGAKIKYVGEYMNNTPSAKKTFEEKTGINFADTIVVRNWEKGLKHKDLFKIIQKPVNKLSAKKTSEEKTGIDFTDTIVVRKPVEKETEIIQKPVNKLSAKKTSEEKIQEDPIKILKIRLAKGEITIKEFEELRKLLDS